MIEKRPANTEEVEAAIALRVSIGSITAEEFKKLYDEAVGEGYKDEVCRCGTIFLACSHFVNCASPDCPMKTKGGSSLLRALLGEEEVADGGSA